MDAPYVDSPTKKRVSLFLQKVDARCCCCCWRAVDDATNTPRVLQSCWSSPDLREAERSWMTEVVQALRRNGTRVWLRQALLRCSTCGVLWLLFLGVHSTNGWSAQHAPAGCPHAPQQTLRHSQHEALGWFKALALPGNS